MPKPHPLRTLVTFLWLALCIVIASLWVRSYLPETLLWESHDGQMLVIALPEGSAGTHEFRNKQSLEQYLGVMRNPQFFAIPPTEHRLLGFYSFTGEAGGYSGRLYMVGIPYWFLMAAAAVPLVIRIRRQRVAARRRAGALCPGCGYDCRATPERCPECGTIPAV